jgi:hypothetical protein
VKTGRLHHNPLLFVIPRAKRKRPVVAVSQLSDFEFPKCRGPKNHKGVLAQFAVSGLQFLRRAIQLDCLFSSMEGLLWLIGQNKYIEFATPTVMAINL